MAIVHRLNDAAREYQRLVNGLGRSYSTVEPDMHRHRLPLALLPSNPRIYPTNYFEDDNEIRLMDVVAAFPSR